MVEKSKYSSEAIIRVYNDKTGDCIEVGPDHDGIDDIEIRCIDGKSGKIGNRINADPEQMRLVAMAILKLTEKEPSEEIND